VIHYADRKLRCHHCDYHQNLVRNCENCRSVDLQPLGMGTQRLEEGLRQCFPQARIVRIDRDSIRGKGELEAELDNIRLGNVDIILGTQLLAKGHDFANLTLVGVVDVDAGLYSIDFRAPERLAQLLTQVAGRAGRGIKPGEVLLQTRHPQHPILQAVVQKGYAFFARQALQERQAAQLPPFSYQALLRAESRDVEKSQELLEICAQQIKESSSQGVDVLGPVAAPMVKKANYYRYQLLLQARQRRDLHRVLRNLVANLSSSRLARQLRWSVDVDPVDLY